VSTSLSTTFATTHSPRWRTPALLAAAGLAASYFYVRAKTREAERTHPPQGQFIEVEGVRLHYIEKGQGPTLLLLHGNGILSEDFRTSGLLDRAARHYRVIAFDRPGFGYSERPRTTIWTPTAQARLLHHALHQLGGGPAIVLGHSWGTLVALAMALEFPQDVRALALLSGYYYPSLRLDAPLSAPPAIPVLGDVLRLTVAPLLTRLAWPGLVKRIFSPAKVDRRFQELPVWLMLRPSQLRASAAESAMMIPSANKLSKRYRELSMPVTIIAGDRDKIADPDHNARRLAETLPGSELYMLPGTGHMVQYADADAIVASIDALEARTRAADDKKAPGRENGKGA
jgi:pimeloyl-ACP methyl ester carboxylesterase